MTSALEKRWLPVKDLTVRKATENKSVRITWSDGSSVECWFTAKDSGKSQVAVQHRKLASKEAAAEMKEFWGERLAALKEQLEK